ncbi:unnamed protein product, partial [Laminaria digitata]
LRSLFLLFSIKKIKTRSLSLGKQGILPERLGAAFLWHRNVRLPAILATATALSVLCTGLLVWAATGSSASFKMSLCLPAIVLAGSSTYRLVAAKG